MRKELDDDSLALLENYFYFISIGNDRYKSIISFVVFSIIIIIVVVIVVVVVAVVFFFGVDDFVLWRIWCENRHEGVRCSTLDGRVHHVYEQAHEGLPQFVIVLAESLFAA